MTRLGVNIDHVATLRQARLESFPDPVTLAGEAIQGGADGITAHLREDRRHIQDKDVVNLKKQLSVPLNMEMAISPDIVRIACAVRPAWTCLVPEKRQELTTEGGLNLQRDQNRYHQVIYRLHQHKIRVSLFIDPHVNTVRLARMLKADAVELHTGSYARFWPKSAGKVELRKIRTAASEARRLGLIVNAGHGLNYKNVKDLNSVFEFDEYNIGFAILARAMSVGLRRAVREMKIRMRR